MPLRVFVIHDDDKFERWPFSKFERVWDGRELMPKTRKLRYCHILVKTKDRRVVDVLRMDFGYLRFDENGRHKSNQALTTAMMAFVGAAESSLDGIVDATRQFARRSATWSPSAWLKNALFQAAFR